MKRIILFAAAAIAFVAPITTMAGSAQHIGLGLALVAATGQNVIASPIYTNEAGELTLAASTGRCRDAVLSLSLDRGAGAPSEWLSGERSCPGPERFVPAENLMIEGLDRRGAILWFAIGRPAPLGLSSDLEREGRVIRVSIALPINNRLARIRWYAITPDLRFQKLGERKWQPRRAPQ